MAEELFVIKKKPAKNATIIMSLNYLKDIFLLKLYQKFLMEP